MQRQPAVNRALLAPDQAEPVQVEYQTFEGTTFPPANWQALDNLSAQNPNYTFSRALCDPDPLTGGLASAWAVGGGAKGTELDCGAAYSEPVESFLLYGPIDTTDYHDGLQVSALFRLNQPVPTGDFNTRVCATQGPRVTDLNCIPVGPENSNWVVYPARQMLWAKEQSQVVFAVMYRDQSPMGGHFGAFVDNILIEGLPGEAATPTPTRAVTQPPPPGSPTATRVVIPTDTPRPTPRPSKVIYLPMLFKNTEAVELPTPASSLMTVGFGVVVDDQGNLIQPGAVFQFGIPSLCARMAWIGQPPLTQMRWQWYRNSRPLNVEGLNGSLSNIPASGSTPSCAVGGEDADGNPIPVPKGSYDVAVYLNYATTATVIGNVVIQDDPPPGATAIPTGPYPTREPTQPEPTATTEGPTPTPTPEPGTGACRSWLTNANFESGPQDWFAFVEGVANQVSPFIVEGSTLGLRPAEGTWLAMIGRIQGSTEEALVQPWPATGPLVEPSLMISATLQMNFGIITDETKNSTHDDTLVVVVADQTGRSQGVERSGYSEESIDPGSWYHYTTPLNVTTLLTKRAGWDTMAFGFQGHNSADKRSIFLIDDVRLTVCERPAAFSLDALLPSAPGRTLGRAANRLTVAPQPVLASPGDLRKLGPMGDEVRRLLR